MNHQHQFRIVEETYPNGSLHGAFYVGRHLIGRAEHVPDGWIPQGKRKVLSDVLAAKAMIDGMISKAHRDEDLARSLLTILRLAAGGSLPSTK